MYSVARPIQVPTFIIFCKKNSIFIVAKHILVAMNSKGSVGLFVEQSGCVCCDVSLVSSYLIVAADRDRRVVFVLAANVRRCHRVTLGINNFPVSLIGELHAGHRNKTKSL